MSTLAGLCLVAQLLTTFAPAFLAWSDDDRETGDLAAMAAHRNTRRALARTTRRR